jgi:hypothetical protein
MRGRAFVRALVNSGHDTYCVFPGDTTGHFDGASYIGVPNDRRGESQVPAWMRAAKRFVLPLPTQSGGKSSNLSRALDELQPIDLVVVMQLPALAALGADRPTRLWLDHSDLFSSFSARQLRSAPLPKRVLGQPQRAWLKRLDRESSRAATIVTAAGWSDAQACVSLSGRAVAWLPTPVAKYSRARLRQPGERPVAGFFANFAFAPNVDALRLLETTWLPRLAAAGWDVVVAGHDSSRVVTSPAIRVLGAVESPQDFYAAVDATLAPIRLGGGMKVKVAESLVNDVPVFATEFAVDGFPPAIRQHVVIVDAHSPEFPRDAPGGSKGADAAKAFGQKQFDDTVGSLLQSAGLDR